MILRRLRLQNYRKFRAVDLEFPTGLIAVVGRNGAGKTSLLEAVAFALYGRNATRDSIEGSINNACGPGETCVVELELEIGGQPCRIVRRLRPVKGPQGHQAEMFDGKGASLAAGVTAVEGQVRRLLGMDYLTFTRSVFSKQKEVNALSTAKPEERRIAVRRMVGIEAVSDAVKAAHQTANAKRDAIAIKQQAIAALPERQEEEQAAKAALGPARATAAAMKRAAGAAKVHAERTRAALKKLGEKQTKDAALQKLQATLAAELSGATKQEQGLEKDLGKLEKQRQELAALAPDEARFNAAKRLRERLDRASGKYEERTQLETGLPDLQRAVERATADVAALADAAAQLQQARAADRVARVAKRQAAARLGSLQKAEVQAEKQAAGHASQAKRVRASLVDIRREGRAGECPTCRRKLGETYEEIIAHLGAELAKHEAAQSKAEGEVAAITKQIADWERKQQAAERDGGRATTAITAGERRREKLKAARVQQLQARRRVAQCEARLRQLRTIDYDEARHVAATRDHEKLEDVHDQVEALRAQVGRVGEVANRLKAVRRQIATATAGFARAEKAQARLGFDPRAHQAADTANEKAQDARLAANDEHTKAAGQVELVEQRLESLRKTVADLQRQKKSIARDEEEVRYLVRLEDLLKQFRDHLAARFKPELAAHASRLLGQMTAGRYPSVELDDDFNVSLNDDGKAYALKRFSGGEEDLANLCLRLAISQVVSHRHSASGSSLVVLDEVFASQDEDRRKLILQALLALQETFQQVVLISHTDDVHDRVPNVLRVTENAAREGVVEWASW